MITVLYIIGYIILMLFTAWALHRWGDLEKEDALGWATFWPITWFFGLVVLCLIPFIWIRDQIIKLWDKLED